MLKPVPILTATLVGLALLVPGNASAKDLQPLLPVTAWNVNWSPTTCTLVRGFGDKGHPDVLWIERYGPTESFDLTFISNEVNPTYYGDPVWITLGSQKPFKRVNTLSGKTVKGDKSLFVGTVTLAPREEGEADRNPQPERPDEAFENSITSLTAKTGSQEVTFRTGPLNKPFAALRACTADLVKSWGLDPEQQASLVKLPQPIGSPARWIVPEDYPKPLLQAGKQAIVHFRLLVDANGHTSACEIQRSISDKKFDEVTCAKLMSRAQFDPARDKLGKAAPSYYLNSVRWVIPR